MTTYLDFTDISISFPRRKLKTYLVTNKLSGEHLGTVYWDKKWRCYVIGFDNVQFSQGCLEEATRFVTRIMTEWKSRMANR
jgi:hypothetical protein